MAVDDTGSSMPSTRARSGTGSTSKPASAPSWRSSATLPRRWWPKWKSSPTTTARAPRHPTSTSATKSSGDSVARVSSKWTTAVMSSPVASSSSSFCSRSVSCGGADSGRTTKAGCLSKVTTADRASRSAGQAADLVDDRPVAEVDAVVGADRDDAARVRGDARVEVAEHLHAG